MFRRISTRIKPRFASLRDFLVAKSAHEDLLATHRETPYMEGAERDNLEHRRQRHASFSHPWIPYFKDFQQDGFTVRRYFQP